MARFKFVDMSPRLLPVDLEAQLVPGTFAHAVHHLVDALDLSAFDAHYRIADNQMRLRDERFADQAKHTSKPDAL